MAGHSQYKNIMFRKGKQDKMRSKIFSKLAREITVAAKAGLPDPSANARLRLAIQNARAENLPKDTIERAIKKAAGSDANSYDAIRYEGYGPGGVAVIVEALTDNRARTAPNVRSYFAKFGGNMGETGSVSFMFATVKAPIFVSSSFRPPRTAAPPCPRKISKSTVGNSTVAVVETAPSAPNTR